MKKAIIIGATSGIGHSLAKLFAAHGYKTGITGRRQHLLQELKNNNPDAFVCKVFDVKHTENTKMILDDLAEELGGLDLLVISSGTGHENPQLDLAPEKDTTETNVDGFMSVAVWAWNYFEKQGYGHIAGITSVAGLRGSRTCSLLTMLPKPFRSVILKGFSKKQHIIIKISS
jgi:short-subunit dehydrogenase